MISFFTDRTIRFSREGRPRLFDLQFIDCYRWQRYRYEYVPPGPRIGGEREILLWHFIRPAMKLIEDLANSMGFCFLTIERYKGNEEGMCWLCTVLLSYFS